MPAGLNPIDNTEFYEFVLIGGIGSPGIATITGADRVTKWDIKEGKGTSGATTTYGGKQIVKSFTIKFTLWTSDHFEAWEQYRKLFNYDPNKKKDKAITISSPILDDNDIHSVVCTNVGQLTHEGSQKFSYSVSFCEFNPPKPAKPTTPASSATHFVETADPSTAPTAPTAQSAQDAQIAALLKQAGLS